MKGKKGQVPPRNHSPNAIICISRSTQTCIGVEKKELMTGWPQGRHEERVSLDFLNQT